MHAHGRTSLNRQRVSTGDEGLDSLIEGGFPRGSLILLAGNPGTGKTVLGTQFLYKGAVEHQEKGIYVSFAESRRKLLDNMSRHLEADLEELDREGKIRVLDFATMREEGISTVLEMILEETRSLEAKRLVVDSLTALAQAFKEPIDVRIILHTILSKIVEKMECTTLLIVEVPTGQEGLGLGIEEFVADGVLVLRKRFSPKMEGRPVRELEVSKMRGTEIQQPLNPFTLKGGFRVFPPFKLEPIKEKRRFQAISDTETHFSTGSRDLDQVFGGGYPRGSLALYEIDENLSQLEWELILCPTMANFMTQGRGGTILPAGGIDADLAAKAMMDLYGFTQEEVDSLLRVQEPGTATGPDRPYRLLLEGEDADEDIAKLMDSVREIKDRTGSPAIYYISFDTAETLWGEEAVKKIGRLSAIRVKKEGDIVIKLTNPGLVSINQKFMGLADLHIRLVKEHGAILLYGEKPRTCLYAVEMDVSKGYPLPRITPII